VTGVSSRPAVECSEDLEDRGSLILRAEPIPLAGKSAAYQFDTFGGGGMKKKFK
jgi:hypothetical protein